VPLGNTFGVNVAIKNVTDLFVFTFDLLYDHTIVRPLSVTPGNFLSLGGLNTTATSLGLPFVLDPNITGGAITGVGDSVIIGSGVNGSGVLANIFFETLALGTSPLTLANVILENSNPPPFGTPIAFTIEHGSALVTPEPTSLVLLASGALVMLLWRRRLLAAR
jgi:hypothetical protein